MRINFLIIGIVLLVASCSPKNLSYGEALDRNAKKLDNQQVRDDARFLVDAQNYNLALIQLAEQADRKGYARVVTDYARMMKDGHTKLAEELEEVADEYKISLPTFPNDNMREDINDLLAESPERYDATFLRTVEALHENAIREFEGAALTANKQEVREFADHFVKMLNEHERKADDLEDRLLLK